MKFIKFLLTVFVLALLYFFGAAQYVVSNLIAWVKALEHIEDVENES